MDPWKILRSMCNAGFAGYKRLSLVHFRKWQTQHKARNYITDFENDLAISAASLWEIAIKTSLGKLELLSPFSQLIPSQLEKNSIAILPIELSHLTEIINLEFHHRDPFDRLIIAQGITEKIPIITSDAVFARYPIDVIWWCKDRILFQKLWRYFKVPGYKNSFICGYLLSFELSESFTDF